MSEPEITHTKEEYRRFRRLFLKRKELNACIACGSFFELPMEYVIANPTDIDKLFWIKIASPAGHSSERLTRHKSESLIVDTKDCHAGFARLRKPETLQEHKQPSYYRRPSVSLPSHGEVYTKGPSWPKSVSTTEFSFNNIRKLFTEFDQSWLGVREFKIDYVYSVYCSSWPTEADEWITRERKSGWPSTDVVDKIVGFGCHLVPKPHQSNPDDDTQWRFSFSQAEVILIQSWTGVQKYIYHVLRIIKSAVVKLCGGEETTVLCTYFFKTLMLWACEQKPAEFWTDENLETSVGELLCQMIEWLIESCCPNYFIPSYNMIDHLQDDIDLWKEITSLLHYKEFYLSTILKTLPKAYLRSPISITLPHKLLVSVLLVYNNCYCMKDSRWESLQTSLIASNKFVPELQYLFKGIQSHLCLMKQSNIQLLFRYKDISFAAKCFDLVTKAQNEDVSPESMALQFSVIELLDQFVEFSQNLYSHKTLPLKSTITGSEGKSYRVGLNESEDLWSANDLSRMLSPSSVSSVQTGRRFVCCYSRECNGRLRSQQFTKADEEPKAMVSYRKLSIFETGISQLLKNDAQGWSSPAYLISAAYFANFYYTALHDYSSAAEQCEKAFQYLHEQSLESKPFRGPFDVVPQFFSVVVINEWSLLFDMYLQIILGFITLSTAVSNKSEGNRRRMVVIHICPLEFLKYIHFQSIRKLNRGQVAEFRCNFNDVVKDMFNGQPDFKYISRILLLTAIRISGLLPMSDGYQIYCVRWPA